VKVQPPTRGELLQTAKDAADFAYNLRRMSHLESASDPRFAAFTAALGTIAGELERLEMALATDKGGPLDPNSVTITETCALILTAMWASGGGRGFMHAMKAIIDGMEAQQEGKS
jgi:hypothetical protein